MLPPAGKSSALGHSFAAAGSGHCRALIEENQALRRDPVDGLLEGLLLLIHFRVAFAGVERLFFSRRPI
jgi:hypothetical protein